MKITSEDILFIQECNNFVNNKFIRENFVFFDDEARQLLMKVIVNTSKFINKKLENV